jgi:predicted NBD/HSP70 family sugar kinase
VSVGAAGGSPARQQSIRVLNEQLLLDYIRAAGEVSRPDLARMSRLSKPTVSLALSNLERAGLIRTSGMKTGAPGRAAILYRVRPEAGHVLALDAGSEFLRGAVADLSGALRARSSLRTDAATGHERVVQLRTLAKDLCGDAGIDLADVTQTVLGSPGVYDPKRDALRLAGALPQWDEPSILSELRSAFGPSLRLENDVNAAALAEQAHGHGRGIPDFAFVSVGTGIGLGLVLGGRLHRGAHGAAGEIGFLPFPSGHRGDVRDARRRGPLEASASAAGIVRAARRAGLRGLTTARSVFAAADGGDRRAGAVVADEARLVAKALSTVLAVADPELVVLGGGVGQADGFLAAVAREVRGLAPVLPELRVSALGTDAVVDGCLAAGLDRAWQIVTTRLSPAPPGDPRNGDRPIRTDFAGLSPATSGV